MVILLPLIDLTDFYLAPFRSLPKFLLILVCELFSSLNMPSRWSHKSGFCIIPKPTSLLAAATAIIVPAGISDHNVVEFP